MSDRLWGAWERADDFVLACVDWFVDKIDQLFPFSHRSLLKAGLIAQVICVAGLYVKKEMWLLFFILQLLRLAAIWFTGPAQKFSERLGASCRKERLSITAVLIVFGPAMGYCCDYLWALFFSGLAVEVYASDGDGKPGKRRRVVDAIKEAITRPGYSTAGGAA